MSPSGKAPDFDSGIRRFKSCHPSHDPLAQLAEQLPFKQWVWSSNLQRVTKKADTHFGCLLFYLSDKSSVDLTDGLCYNMTMSLRDTVFVYLHRNEVSVWTKEKLS